MDDEDDPLLRLFWAAWRRVFGSGIVSSACAFVAGVSLIAIFALAINLFDSIDSDRIDAWLYEDCRAALYSDLPHSEKSALFEEAARKNPALLDGEMPMEDLSCRTKTHDCKYVYRSGLGRRGWVCVENEAAKREAIERLKRKRLDQERKEGNFSLSEPEIPDAAIPGDGTE